MLEHQNIKTFLQKAMFQISLKKFLWLKRLKILCHRHMLLVILRVKEFLERFTKKNCKKIKNVIKVEKVITRKGNKLYVKWKCYYSSFNSWIDKKDVIYDFLLVRRYFKSNDGNQNFLVSTPMLSSKVLDSNKRVTNWISTGISSEKIKPFDTNLEPTMPNLANGRAILKFNNPVLVQKSLSLLYSNFILDLYIVYNLNNW